MARVLVIIPTVDRPKMCRRAVDSLLQQTYTDWDLVIAKNGPGSPVAYAQALEGLLADPRIRLMVFPGTGLAYALNSTLAAFGEGHEFFANLEDDDEWDSEFLAVMTQALEEGGSVAHCQQRQKPSVRQSNGGPMDRHMIKVHNWINFPMCLFRTDLWLDRVKETFCTEAGPATDWDWHLRCLQAGAVYKFVPRTLVTHHWHGRNYCLAANHSAFIKARIAKGVYN